MHMRLVLLRSLLARKIRGARITTTSSEQTMTIINESGLYSLVLSRKGVSKMGTPGSR